MTSKSSFTAHIKPMLGIGLFSVALHTILRYSFVIHICISMCAISAFKDSIILNRTANTSRHFIGNLEQQTPTIDFIDYDIERTGTPTVNQARVTKPYSTNNDTIQHVNQYKITIDDKETTANDDINLNTSNNSILTSVTNDPVIDDGNRYTKPDFVPPDITSGIITPDIITSDIITSDVVTPDIITFITTPYDSNLETLGKTKNNEHTIEDTTIAYTAENILTRSDNLKSSGKTEIDINKASQDKPTANDINSYITPETIFTRSDIDLKSSGNTEITFNKLTNGINSYTKPETTLTRPNTNLKSSAKSEIDFNHTANVNSYTRPDTIFTRSDIDLKSSGNTEININGASQVKLTNGINSYTKPETTLTRPNTNLKSSGKSETVCNQTENVVNNYTRPETIFTRSDIDLKSSGNTKINVNGASQVKLTNGINSYTKPETTLTRPNTNLKSSGKSEIDFNHTANVNSYTRPETIFTKSDIDLKSSGNTEININGASQVKLTNGINSYTKPETTLTRPNTNLKSSGKSETDINQTENVVNTRLETTLTRSDINLKSSGNTEININHTSEDKTTINDENINKNLNVTKKYYEKKLKSTAGSTKINHVNFMSVPTRGLNHTTPDWVTNDHARMNTYYDALNHTLPGLHNGSLEDMKSATRTFLPEVYPRKNPEEFEAKFHIYRRGRSKNYVALPSTDRAPYTQPSLDGGFGHRPATMRPEAHAGARGDDKFTFPPPNQKPGLPPGAIGAEGKLVVAVRTTPFRLSFEEDCDYLAYYCLKAYDTGKLCGRTLYYTYHDFPSYCMMDYVNCMERFEDYPYENDYFLDQYYMMEDIV